MRPWVFWVRCWRARSGRGNTVQPAPETSGGIGTTESSRKGLQSGSKKPSFAAFLSFSKEDFDSDEEDEEEDDDDGLRDLGSPGGGRMGSTATARISTKCTAHERAVQAAVRRLQARLYVVNDLDVEVALCLPGQVSN